VLAAAAINQLIEKTEKTPMYQINSIYFRNERKKGRDSND
jgi:hypothetical protein